MEKYCEISHECPYGDAFTPNRCACEIEDEDFECPATMENYEYQMERIAGGWTPNVSKQDSRIT